MNPLALLPGSPMLWRLGAYLVLFLAGLGIGAAKMHESDQAKYDALEAGVKAAGDKQNELTQKAIALHNQLRHSADEEADRLRAERDRAVFDANRLQHAAASRRLLPAPAAGTQGPARLCYPADQLDQQIGAALDEAAGEDLGDSAVGQAGVDIAHVCHDYAAALSKNAGTMPAWSWRVSRGTRTRSD